MNAHLTPHHHQITPQHRIQKQGYYPLLIWFVGLSGSGKSTLASALEAKLFAEGIHTYILDGDNIRSGLNSDLDFSNDSRRENIRRVAEVARLFVEAGVVTLSAFITPFQEDRDQVRALLGEHYLEVFVKCSLAVCETRDVKGLYQKARQGTIPNFTGIDSPFESPKNADIEIASDQMSISEGVQKIYDIVIKKIKKDG